MLLISCQEHRDESAMTQDSRKRYDDLSKNQTT